MFEILATNSYSESKITYETNFKYPTEQIRLNSITYDIYNRFTPYTL